MLYITACVYMETKDGDYWYTSEGHSSAVCGLFLIGEPDQLIEIEFLDFNIGCKNGNVMGVRICERPYI